METKDILKALRKAKGFNNAKDFCDASGISYNTYQNYEAGKRMPPAETLILLADFYGVTTDYLLGREPAPDPFGELNISEDDEKAVLSKYMSLPENVRAIMLDVLRQLGTAAKDRENDSAESDASVTETAAFVEKRLADDAEAQENAG